ATCPEVSVRNRAKALDYALKAVSLSPTACHLDTLAASYAEAGQFDLAVKTQERVVELVESSKAPGLRISEAVSKLDLYKASQPYRQQ
ncbi:MAG: sel1 repeat family protein, partial [Thermodesulfobacteriota bacterium]